MRYSLVARKGTRVSKPRAPVQSRVGAPFLRVRSPGRLSLSLAKKFDLSAGCAEIHPRRSFASRFRRSRHGKERRSIL